MNLNEIGREIVVSLLRFWSKFEGVIFLEIFIFLELFNIREYLILEPYSIKKKTKLGFFSETSLFVQTCKILRIYKSHSHMYTTC